MIQTRHLLAIQSISSFVSGALSILIPLLLIERNISIQNIGLIFAIYPIVFQLGRVSFGVISDFFGRKPFYVLNIFFGVITNIIYYFSFSILGYASGKLFEGLKDAALWSVNRASILEQSDKEQNKQRNLMHLQITVFISNAIGIFVSGFLITYLFFSNIIIFCAAISLITLPSVFVLKDKLKTKITFSRLIDKMNLKKKSALFKRFILLFCILGIFNGLTADYIFPTFLKSKGFDAENIGMLLGLEILLSGIFVFLFRKWKNLRKLILLSGLLTMIFLAPIGFSNYIFIVVLTVLLGMSGGISQVAMEIISMKTANQKSYGSDIGLLFIGFHIARTVTLAFSGFIIATLGFGNVFAIAAIIIMVYSIFASLQFRKY